MRQDRFAYLLLKVQDGGEICSRGLDGLFDPQVDRRPSREPLLGAQHHARSTQDPGQDRKIGVGRDFEGAKMEDRKPDPTGKCAFREHDKRAALLCGGDDRLDIAEVARNIDAFRRREHRAGAGKE